ncbi:hypothetical protein GOACH_06_01470 [Gordonia aichiensis NBRC 108223]|uniref:Chaperone protein n=2 Tax=Gordonia aichiensis TaxID=36820 RepID=L7KIE5_9ACTN|nr:hypothetical protein GOACH_06_01470 [Gordonia aichiensis NBRC 108223]
MGVSLGRGMIHFVLLTRDDSGRELVESRVIDVDTSDGHDTPGRVNAGIDLMLDAARDADRRVGPIGVAAGGDLERDLVGSTGSGPRRQIHLVSVEQAVAAYLIDAGVIGRYRSVVVVDCGDTGMTLYTVDPASGAVSDITRSRALSGRALDDAIVRVVGGESGAARGPLTTKISRSALRSAVRTAKEEPSDDDSVDAAGRFRIDDATLATALRPFLADARDELSRYLAQHPACAVVLVGGLANLPTIADMVPDEDDENGPLEVVVPANPEQAAAVGAALLSSERASASSRLAFMGGGRRRGALSPMPVAVAAVVIAAAMFTVYAVGSTLTSNSTHIPSPSSARVASLSTESDETDRVPSQTTQSQAQHTSTSAQAARTTREDDGPGWATIQLPPTTPSPTTLTLSARPSTPTTTPPQSGQTSRPRLPLPPGITIPPSLLPPEFLAPSGTPGTRTPTPEQPGPSESNGGASQPNDQGAASSQPAAPTTTTTTTVPGGLLPPP